MAAEFFTRETAPGYKRRFERLAADTPRCFGALTPAGMLRHMRFVFEASNGDADSPDRSTWITRNVVRILFFHWFTNWPGGKIKAPDAFTPAPDADLDTERKRLFDAMDRFLDRLDREPDRLVMTLALGPRPLRYWTRIHGLHTRHHLKQFGL